LTSLVGHCNSLLSQYCLASTVKQTRVATASVAPCIFCG
jgi:hypothetical protein